MVHTCPTCTRSFDSRRGLAVHHSHVHDERLPNRECHRCGTSFYSEHEKRYCSDDCRDAAVSYEGQDNPNYSGAKERTRCTICDEPFEYYPSEKEGYYCPDCVANEQWRHIREISGTDNPNWRGGGIDDYGPGWRAVRERALDRDGHACVVCGTDDEAIGRNPDVHHVVPVRLFAASPILTVTDAHTLDNVVSLCPGCHRRVEFGHLSRAELRWRAGIAVQPRRAAGPYVSRPA